MAKEEYLKSLMDREKAVEHLRNASDDLWEALSAIYPGNKANLVRDVPPYYREAYDLFRQAWELSDKIAREE
jgi:hypothetical protein